jgi:hypothetical protein
MPRCPRCEVDLAPDAANCPLCGAVIDPSRALSFEGLLEQGEGERLTEGERRKLAAELLSVSILIPAVAVSAVNLLLSHAITWGLYPLLSLALGWVLIAAAIGIFGRKPGALVLPAIAVILFLPGLDLANGRLSWSLSIGIPIVLIVEAVTALVALASLKSARRGANVPAFIILGVILVCLGVESTVDLAVSGSIRLAWSAVVAFALAPIALFLFYLHHRLSTRSSLRKLFRL